MMATQFKPLVLAALMLVVPPAALAQASALAPAGAATTSVAQADARLAEVASARAQAQAQFAVHEEICYTKFFVNHCLDHAREERRMALSSLRAIEIEARYFKRLDAADKRDLALAERNAEADADIDADAVAAAAKAAPCAVVPAKAAAAPLAKALDPARRPSEHQAKEARQQAQQSEGAGQRAANVAAYDEKQRASEQRQREIAAKLADRARAAEAAKNP